MKLSVLLVLLMAFVGCGGNSSARATTVAPTAAGLPAITVTAASTQPLAVSHTYTGTLQLSTPAPAGGIVVTLSSSNASIVAVAPATISVAAGATSVSFTYTGMVPGTSTLSASAAGYTLGSVSLTSVAPQIPRTAFGMSVNKASLEQLNMPFTYGTTRTWDVYPALGWDAISAGPGYYNFAELDAYIWRTQVSNAADIIYTLGHTPQWASSQPNVWCKEGNGSCAPPARMQDWDDWVRAVATHTLGRIHIWELWNEPQDAGYYAGDIPTMVTMAQHAYTIIKSIDPNAIILSPSAVGGYGPGWLNAFLAAGGGKYVDAIAFHGYWSDKAEDIQLVVTNFRAVMAANGAADKPMWDTESDYSGSNNPPSNYADRAAFVAKYYLLHWALGVDRFAWYMYDGGWWGGLWDADAGIHADGTAWGLTKNWMEGASMVKPCSADSNGTWTCDLSRSGNYLGRAIWNSTATVPYTPGSNFTRMKDLTGVTTALTGAALQIGNQPILLEGTPPGATSAGGQSPSQHMVYLQQPQSAFVGTQMATVQVAVEDASGNIVTNAIGYATIQYSPSAPLGGIVIADFINGVATFWNLSGTIPGQFTLTTTADGLAPAVSVGFTMVARPVTTHLVFLQQPQSAYVNTSMATFQVADEDAYGNVMTGAGGSVNIALAGTGGAALTGATTVPLVNGVATFAGLAATATGQFTLAASSDGVGSAVSTGFTVSTAPVATHLVFVQQPQSAYQNTGMATIQVADEDDSGNVNTAANGYVELELVGGGGGTLTGATTAFLVNGVATFQNLSVNVPAPYTMAAYASAGYTAGHSVAFSIAPTPPTPMGAGRFLQQAGFGATDASISHVQFLGLQNYLQEQFLTPASLIPTFQTNAPAFCGDIASCVRYSWWGNALNGPDQLRQRVAFALSEMFVVSTQSTYGYFMPTYLNTLSQDAFTNWYTIMRDMTLNPGMATYLNSVNSMKPANGQTANQNFAREMLQVFSTGAVQLNNDGTPILDSNGQPKPLYNQAQVDGFARAYTGWTYGSPNGAPLSSLNWAPSYYVPLTPIDNFHDMNAKPLLDGVTLPAGQSASQDMDEALHNIFNNSSLPPFICKQLIQHLVTSNPSPNYVASVAAVFVNNGYGVRGDMQSVISAILLNSEARAGDAGTVDPLFGHQREPILWLAEAYRGLAATPGLADMRSYAQPDVQAQSMGEMVQSSPSVFNFYSPSYALPGTTTLAPEFELEQTTSVQARLNSANQIAFSDWGGYINIDFSWGGYWASLAGPDCNPLLDKLNRVFMHSAMPASMRTTIYNTISGMPSPVDRARMAVYLVLTSPQFKYSN